jgi:hypothetical protein
MYFHGFGSCALAVFKAQVSIKLDVALSTPANA